MIIMVALLPLAGLRAWYGAVERRNESIETQQDQQLHNRLRAEATIGEVEQARATLAALALSRRLASKQWPQTSALLTQLAEVEPGYSHIVMADLSGVIRSASTEASGTVGRKVINQQWFRRALGTRGFAVGDYEPAGVGLQDVPSITFSNVVTDAQGRVVGVVGINAPISALRKVMSTPAIPEGVTVSIIENNGRVVVRKPDPEHLEGKMLSRRMLEDWLSRSSFRPTVIEDTDGRRKLVSYALVAGSKDHALYVVNTVDLERSLRAEREAEYLTVGAFLLLAAVTVGLALYGSSRWVVQPVDKLVDAAERMGAGDLSAPVVLPRSASGEFVQLQDEFNAMADTLETKIEELEKARELERTIADTLQQGLLALPASIPHLEIASTYHSATEFARVGGDFYDLFELDDGRIGIVVGDISGKGLDAAAFTSLVKNTIRVLSTEVARSPAEVMRRANQVITRETNTEWFVTVFFAIFLAEEDYLVYCNAGHTTGLIRTVDGDIRQLPSTSPIAGAYLDLAYEDAHADFRTGDTLVLYTDGLIEARHERAFYGEQRLFELVENAEGASPEDVCELITRSVLDFTGGTLSDDLALLILRRNET